MNKARAGIHRDADQLSDLRLIRECLKGSERAWSALVDRYKNLIFSVPVRTGVSADDAPDIFQAVCLDLLCELPRLRNPRALPRWLVQVTYHKCLRWKADRGRYWGSEMTDENAERGGQRAPVPDELLYESERSQKIRQVLAQLDPRCRQLVEALFFETPARPYLEVARSLGMPLGAIGPVRERCLKRVRKLLEQAGFR